MYLCFVFLSCQKHLHLPWMNSPPVAGRDALSEQQVAADFHDSTGLRLVQRFPQINNPDTFTGRERKTWRFNRLICVFNPHFSSFHLLLFPCWSFFFSFFRLKWEFWSVNLSHQMLILILFHTGHGAFILKSKSKLRDFLWHWGLKWDANNKTFIKEVSSTLNGRNGVTSQNVMFNAQCLQCLKQCRMIITVNVYRTKNILYCFL